jgi:PKD repeat protein
MTFVTSLVLALKNRQMKKLLIQNRLLSYFIFFFFLISLQVSYAQEWRNNLPKEKIKNGTLTLQDYQKAFNDYWEPFNLDRGYYYKNGEKIKAEGWKQFKRWEWYWENRVDAKTGEFPNTTAWEVFREYLKGEQGNRSPDGNWTSMGPSETNGGYAGLGRLNCIAFHPDDENTLYVGAASGGIWKTTTGGNSWVPLGDNNAALGVSDIIVQTDGDTEILYIATGDRDASDTYSVGVLKSIDGGITWQTTGLDWSQNQYRLINRLQQDMNDPNTIWAATSNGLYKTTDGGDSWDQLSSLSFKDLEFRPGSNLIMYGSNTSGDVYRSLDGGINWGSRVLNTSGERTQLAVSSDDPDVVYALISNSSNALKGVYKSVNGGETFDLTFNSVNMLGWNCDGSGSGGQGWYDLCIASDPYNADIVFVGGVNTWKSEDGGYTWIINNHWSGTCSGIATNVHADKHFFAYQPGTSNLFECNDGGLYKTTNEGDTWTHLGSGLVTSQIYRIGVAQTVDNDVIIGLQDNGTKSLLYGNWDDVIGGDGMDCMIDWSNELVQYGELYYGNIKRTTNHWNSYTTISNSISGNAAWVTPMIQDLNEPNTIYVGYQDVWKSTNRGNSWTKISNWNGYTLRSLAISKSNSDFIYTATRTTLYRFNGLSWSNITNSLPTGSAYISYIAVKADDPSTAWVSMSGFNPHGVYETTDGGTTWNNISSGLPQLPVNCVIQNRLNTDEVELYAGTDVGVYLKLGDDDWTPFYNNLPNVVVTELEIYYDDVNELSSRIRAATYGRGVWESDLYSIEGAPVADFEASILIPTVEDTVFFTDLSINEPNTWAWEFSPDNVTYIEGTNSLSQNPVVMFDEIGNYTVKLTVVNDVSSDSKTKNDYINTVDFLFAVAAAIPDTICIGESCQLISEATGGAESLSYAWTSDPEGFESDIQNPIVAPEETTTYMVEISDGHQSAVDEVMVVVNPLPEITLGDWPEMLCNQQEPPIQLTATPEGGTYSGDGVSETGLFSPETAPLGWNIITYAYTDVNDCEAIAQDSIFVDECVGFNVNLSEENYVKIYPNPNKGSFSIESSLTIQNIEIYKVDGERIFSENTGGKKVAVTAILSKGVYIARIFLEDRNESQFIVNKKLIIK